MKYRKHDWFDTNTMKPVLSLQAQKHSGGHWMHVLKDEGLKTFANEGLRTSWINRANKRPKPEGK